MQEALDRERYMSKSKEEIVFDINSDRKWDPSYIKFLKDELRGDKDIGMAAVRSNAFAFEYLSEELRGDKDIGLAAVRSNAFAVEYLSEELRGDKDIGLAAVRSNAFALEYLSDELRNDKDVGMAALEKNYYAIEYLSENLRNDKDILRMLPAHVVRSCIAGKISLGRSAYVRLALDIVEEKITCFYEGIKNLHFRDVRQQILKILDKTAWKIFFSTNSVLFLVCGLMDFVNDYSFINNMHIPATIAFCIGYPCLSDESRSFNIFRNIAYYPIIIPWIAALLYLWLLF